MMWPTLEHTVENFSVAAPLDNNPLVLGTPAWVNNSLVMLLAGLLSKIIDFENPTENCLAIDSSLASNQEIDFGQKIINEMCDSV